MNRLTQYRDNVYPLRWDFQFAAERALLMVLPQIGYLKVTTQQCPYWPGCECREQCERGESITEPKKK